MKGLAARLTHPAEDGQTHVLRLLLIANCLLLPFYASARWERIRRMMASAAARPMRTQSGIPIPW
jgi:uncharacterized membrane protein YidH (DUF202 family)